MVLTSPLFRMLFLVATSLFLSRPLLLPYAVAVQRSDDAKGTILSPTAGTSLAPGAPFHFSYKYRADYSVSSYNYTVWLATKLPTGGVDVDGSPQAQYMTGHFFGRFSEANHPANDYPPNPPPSYLVMPDFSRPPPGWGAGRSASDVTVYLLVMEEWGTGPQGEGELGWNISMVATRLVYNGTSNEGDEVPFIILQ